MEDEKYIAMAERVTAMETKLEHIQEGNRVFRDEIRNEIHEIKKQNEAIYEIASSVRLIARDVQGLKDDVKDVKEGQQALSEKMDGEITAVKKEQGTLRDQLTESETRDATMLVENVQKVKWSVIGAIASAVVLYIAYLAFPMLK